MELICIKFIRKKIPRRHSKKSYYQPGMAAVCVKFSQCALEGGCISGRRTKRMPPSAAQ